MQSVSRYLRYKKCHAVIRGQFRGSATSIFFGKKVAPQTLSRDENSSHKRCQRGHNKTYLLIQILLYRRRVVYFIRSVIPEYRTRHSSKLPGYSNNCPFFPPRREIRSKSDFSLGSCLNAVQAHSTRIALRRGFPCRDICPNRRFSPDEYSWGVSPV